MSADTFRNWQWVEINFEEIFLFLRVFTRVKIRGNEQLIKFKFWIILQKYQIYQFSSYTLLDSGKPVYREQYRQIKCSLSPSLTVFFFNFMFNFGIRNCNLCWIHWIGKILILDQNKIVIFGFFWNSLTKTICCL